MYLLGSFVILSPLTEPFKELKFWKPHLSKIPFHRCPTFWAIQQYGNCHHFIKFYFHIPFATYLFFCWFLCLLRTKYCCLNTESMRTVLKSIVGNNFYRYSIVRPIRKFHGFRFWQRYFYTVNVAQLLEFIDK